MNNKQLWIAGIVILIIGAVGIGFFASRGSSPNNTPTPAPTEEVIEILPQDALDVTLKPGKTPLYTLTIAKIPQGVTGLSYEITYDTTNKGSQGLAGGLGEPIAIKEGQTEYTNDKIVFGSESRGKYDLDKGVSNIQVSIRLVYKDGSEKGWKGSLSL